MDFEYDLKFDEMKKYIPFLDNMINRLESTSSESNPRQTQLDKIRSLRDLLLDKKKRMKMENLLKCEQVLVNLYAKVEQREALPGIQPASMGHTSKDPELETVRNKLKIITTKTLDQDTLPEIARASATEELCTPGSKEPALFQRRPNKASPRRSSQISPVNSSSSSSSRRNYTRVLVSPERRNSSWSSIEKNPPLFSRRSPRSPKPSRSPKRPRSPKRSPKRRLSPYMRNDKRRPKQELSKKAKDLNITLNVPEDSLNSLNTKDILSRIMNCNDNDVDIATLREAKRQILSELKHTGAKYNDISDLLLKSYKKKSSKKKDEVEEGELSDSESEAIQSIYGNFILDDNKTSSKNKGDSKEKPRKIQICLVLNADKDEMSADSCTLQTTVPPNTIDDFELCDDAQPSTSTYAENTININTTEDHNKIRPIKNNTNENVMEEKTCTSTDKTSYLADVATNQPANYYKPLNDRQECPENLQDSSKSACINNSENNEIIENKDKNEKLQSTALEVHDLTLSPRANKTELQRSHENENSNKTEGCNKSEDLNKSEGSNTPEDCNKIGDSNKLEDRNKIEEKEIEIPLLHEPSVASQQPKEDIVSEIDILQALKNEILSESLSIPGSEITPALHQPKVTKVLSVQEIIPKKRISIEKYKKKTISTCSSSSLFVNDPSSASKEDILKKQSLKLTEKEFERFNLSAKLALGDADASEDEEIKGVSLDEIYADLEPKSPNQNDRTDQKAAPILIPTEPAKTILTSTNGDIDMRQLIPPKTMTSALGVNESSRLSIDPRIRKDLNTVPSPDISAGINFVNKVPIAQNNFLPNMTPNRNLNTNVCMTPTMQPNMTPSRNPNMTPNARSYEISRSFDGSDNISKKHVYAPAFPLCDQSNNRGQSVTKEQENSSYWDNTHEGARLRTPRWDTVENRDHDSRSTSVQRDIHEYSKPRYNDAYNNTFENYNSRYTVDQRDSFNRIDPLTPLPSFGRSDVPTTPTHPFGRLEIPPTPLHAFGRLDCPTTPNHQFGRLDCPQTPIHPFGRLECPQTPSHPFGRLDCPQTPSHPFGRSECPMTPIHPFGRSEMPMTPNHPFGRSEHSSRDPRLNRSSDYENIKFDDRTHNTDRNRSSYNSYNKSDSYRRHREQSVGRCERNTYTSRDDQDQSRSNREPSVGRTIKKVDSARNYTRDYHNTRDKDATYSGYHREQSIGRSLPNNDNLRKVDRRSENAENELSVQSHAGRSFVINTSINSTFQESINFDNRRKRAASVGRIVHRESSVGRSFRETSTGRSLRESSIARSFFRETSVGRSHQQQNMSSYEENYKRNDFRRARSVGRDLVGTVNVVEKSFIDIKDDFRKYKASYDAMYDKKEIKSTSHSHVEYDNRGDTYHKSNSQMKERRKYEKYDTKKYSPSSNNRDPRMRRESNSKHTQKERKHLGIAYTNDNITKGTILGPGYGVKNYKIPKIKRPVDEKPTEDKKKHEQKCEDAKNNAVKKHTQDTNSKKTKNSEAQIKLETNKKRQNNVKNTDKKSSKNDLYEVDDTSESERRLTRLGRKSDSQMSENVGNYRKKIARKVKKPAVLDSDSDTEDSHNINTSETLFENSYDAINESSQNSDSLDNISLSSLKQSEKSLAEVDNKNPKRNTSIQLENNFHIDDLDIFSDNITSDPVIDSINDIIAGLDTDLEPDKTGTSEDLTSDINIEKMLDVIDSNEENGEKLSEELNDISEVINEDLVECDNIQRNQNEEISLTNDVNEQHQVSRKILENKQENMDKTAGKKTDKKYSNENYKENNEAGGDTQNILKNMNTILNNANETKENNIRDNLAEKLSPKISKNVMNNDVTYNNTADNKLERKGTNVEEPVSTSEINKDSISEKEERSNTVNSEVISAPDSTNEIVSEQTIPDESTNAPDSTNESQNDINSVVTSSHDSVENVNTIINTEASTSNKDTTSIDSLGNILSLLQNKSKLKEILSMLGDNSSENDKIKKKLEKLSEIVSDEDDESESKENQSKEIKNKSVLNNLCVQNSSNDDNIDQTVEEKSECEQHEKEVECSEKVADEEHELRMKKKVQRKRKRGKFTKKKKDSPKVVKRLTRSGAKENVIKKPSRELLKLHEDIREMFISDDVLNATGLRMCRIAKLMDDNKVKSKEDVQTEATSEPVVVLEKFKNAEHNDNLAAEKHIKKKPGPKPKQKIQKSVDTETSVKAVKLPKYKPGPKSKKLAQKDVDDPYEFESDSVSESNDKSFEDNDVGGSESENESVNSGISSEILVERKKKLKRKKSEWQSGIIRTKNKKKKSETIQNDDISASPKVVHSSQTSCFTDKTYCFRKNVSEYSCRLCLYNGNDIVNHYKQHHPHSEIPLSRLSPEMAKEAIDQCEEINFQAISKIPSEKYVCRFCLKEFSKKKAALEAFFWHVVSMHTGEYKQLCSICEEDKCPFYLDIPPPPKDVKGQLIGYICEKCNFTQISLENLKTHVIVRHNDEQTEVYTINLAVMSRKAISKLIYRSRKEHEPPRTLRSHRSNQSLTSDEQSDITDSDVSNEPLQCLQRGKTSSPLLSKQSKTANKSKITFEYDDSSETSSIVDNLNNVVKVEKDVENETPIKEQNRNTASLCNTNNTDNNLLEQTQQTLDIPPDIYIHPHFKVSYTEGGSKEYLCCINVLTHHYKTSLLISLKKHVQTKHSESWDGYCTLCKVIVTSQGKHSFSECLLHYLDKHIDELPVVKNLSEEPQTPKVSEVAVVATPPNKPYINVRPISELLSEKVDTQPQVTLPVVPKEEYFPSLDTTDVQPLQSTQNDIYPTVFQEPEQEEKQYEYEENQAEVLSKKHRVVLDVMLNKNKLVHIFKCAGRYCSFSSDSVEDSLLHASTHQRVGGEKSMMCTYCDFDSSGNAIDLVMHVFKTHSLWYYACSYCFYRAVSTQLVMAHITRVHSGSPLKVLSTSNDVPPVPCKILPRGQVVRSYICAHHDCSFKHYTAGRFCEHLDQEHSNADGHPCYLCAELVPTAAALIQHMKVHGLNIFQCAFCCFGADAENFLVSHTSEKHPFTEPQGYLRTSQNKFHSTEAALLPTLAFHKVRVPVELVQPCTDTKNPVRDAERSIDLENLIGHTNQLIEKAVPVGEPSRVASPMQQHHNEESILPDSDPMEVSIVPIEPAVLVPATSPREADTSEQTTPVVKAEVIQTPTQDLFGDVVYCLDSDEEDVPDVPADTSNVSTETFNMSAETSNISADTSNVSAEISNMSAVASISADTANISADNSSVDKSGTRSIIHGRENIKIPPTRLLQCPKCLQVYKDFPKSSSFVKHLVICCADHELHCVHCGQPVAGREDLVRHYILNHCNLLHVCAVCKQRFYSAGYVRRHLQLEHKASKVNVSSQRNEKGQFEYSYALTEETERPAPPKPAGAGKAALRLARRKSSAAGAERRPLRYGPGDVGRLPINPILDEPVGCARCEFTTKVRLNMVRHLQMHAESQPAPNTAPVNPVPHLETNEMHFDRMVNLASSSLARPVAAAAAAAAAAAEGPLRPVAPEAAGRYPRYVPGPQRHACGARGCSYISLDEVMLRCHWETLHADSDAFKCVHCPPYQQLDTKRPITAARIIAHLKMHDANLYGCSSCPYYHFKRYMLDRHVSETHAGNASALLVREEAAAGGPAPTMDLKPWRCGLCDFVSMMRPEVVEHCSKCHQSKMQFKCFYCPYRTSAEESVTKHQANVHPGKKVDVFYFYYREGSIPGETEGGPLWVRQRQRSGLAPVIVKSEPSPDLDVVKQEAGAAPLTAPELCAMYGDFCDPNGLLYKCPVCKSVTEPTEEAMRSHLYEELNYRRWACTLCSYRAFHKMGLGEHMKSEHRTSINEPRQIPVNVNIEAWVAKALEHQTGLIAKNKENFAKQNVVLQRVPAKEATPSVPSSVPNVPSSVPNVPSSVPNVPSAPDVDMNVPLELLMKAFGPLGHAAGASFCCPKCCYQIQDETAFANHMESELNKIRWCCTSCSNTYQTYHETQLHCRSLRALGGGHLDARPAEAPRDPAFRAAWLRRVVNFQKEAIQILNPQEIAPEPQPEEQPDNALLVVRYEKPVTPDEPPITRKRPASPPLFVSEDEEEQVKRGRPSGRPFRCKMCPHISKSSTSLKIHMYAHFNMRPINCKLCGYNGYRQTVIHHLKKFHSSNVSQVGNKVHLLLEPAPLPKFGPGNEPPRQGDDTRFVCLVCEKSFTEEEIERHGHENMKSEFGKKGDIVIKCCTCLTLRIDMVSFREHHAESHPNEEMNYAFSKLLHETRDVHCCTYCKKRFTYIKDLRSHHNAVHSSFPMKYNTSAHSSPSHSSPSHSSPSHSSPSKVVEIDDDVVEIRPSPTSERPTVAPKMVARKSTTKLPAQAVAKKSTTKLPFDYYDDDDDEEYSYYGNKPEPLDTYSNVTTLMSFCNRMMPFTVQKLSELIKIDPVVLVKDMNQNLPPSE